MAIADLATHLFIGGGGSVTIGIAMTWAAGKMDKRSEKKRIAKNTVDGRTPAQWLETIKALGKEEYERLSRGALDGLEESKTYGRWDVKPLLGIHYNQLMREWYPEKYCEYCHTFTNGIPGNCFWDGPCEGYLDNNRPVRKVKSDRAKEVEKAIDQLTVGQAIKTGNISITSDGMTINSRKIQITEIGYRGSSERKYRISRDKETWHSSRDDIGAFQARKGLQPTGVVDSVTRGAITKYLQAGNPWPVKFPKSASSLTELQRLESEINKWEKRTNDMNKEIARSFDTPYTKISRYDRNGRAHW